MDLVVGMPGAGIPMGISNGHSGQSFRLGDDHSFLTLRTLHNAIPLILYSWRGRFRVIPDASFDM